MTTYRIESGRLHLGPRGTWEVKSGGIIFDPPSPGWLGYLDGNDFLKECPPAEADGDLDVNLEGGGKLRGCCHVFETSDAQTRVAAQLEPEEFVEPPISEAD
jgi:hypothetical protein